MNAFGQLDPSIVSRLLEKGITKPTLPQELAIPAILSSRNVLLIAPTGTGKTEAAALPVLSMILSTEDAAHAAPGRTGGETDRWRKKGERKGISVIYITPLRALNRDMLRRLEEWGDYLGLDVAVRHGDTSKAERSRQSRSPPDLIISTPETLQVMLTGKRLRQNLSNVKFVIVDEVHELADSKRGSQLSVLLERLHEVAGPFQRIGLSATVGSPEQVAALLAGTNRTCEILRADVERSTVFSVISPKAGPSDAGMARELQCEADLVAAIQRIREEVRGSKTLIFVNTRQAAEVLSSRFKQLGEPIGVHHGSLSKDTRIEAEEAFKEGRLRGLICTSSMELGIDIGDVEHVIQYSSPREVARLVQRVGRAGHRVGRTAKGTIIATNPDDIAEACAIARRAEIGSVEEIKIHHNPADVLANQLVGLSLDFGEISFDKAQQIVKRAYPFKDLTSDGLKEVIDEILDHRIIGQNVDSPVLHRRRSGLQYYFENLSMIPDEKRFDVYDMVSRKTIGSLDEAFVINFAKPGATFVTRGEIWEVSEIEDDRIKVVPIQRSGEIPSWTGEEIPVPFEVAQEVGEIRSTIASILEGENSTEKERDEGAEAEAGTDDLEGTDVDGAKDIDYGTNDGSMRKRMKEKDRKTDLPDRITKSERFEQAVRFVMKKYPADRQAASELVSLIRSQLDKHLPIPDSRSVTVESDGAVVVINACFGHKVNDALGRAITALLSSRFGSTVAMQIDPYRIILELPKPIIAEEAVSLIADLDPSHLRPILEMTLKNTTLLRWKMVHVARKFGALRRDIDYERVSMSRLLGIFENTPMYREALREIFHERLDIRKAEQLLGMIRSGEIDVQATGPSPIGAAARGGGGRDVASPEHADAAVIGVLRQRIMSDRVILFCVNCKKWKSIREVSRVPDQPQCPLCSSRMIAALKPWEEDDIKAVKREESKKTAEEKRQTKRVFRNANLVLTYGKTAAIALASRGLGPETAARVIAKMRTDEDGFYRDILKAEREYARTKRFWA